MAPPLSASPRRPPHPGRSLDAINDGLFEVLQRHGVTVSPANPFQFGHALLLLTPDPPTGLQLFRKRLRDRLHPHACGNPDAE
jgi:hypothetical protein